MNKKSTFKTALSLFLIFFKIGAFSFGGGYSMISMIENEIVEKKKWIESGDLLDVVAISESTPGPIAINVATFVGFKTCGFFGAFMATIGVILPSFTIIYIISFVMKQFQSSKIVQYAFQGVRAGVFALIIKALITMYKQCPKSIISYIIAGVAFLLVAFFNINVLAVIAGCAIVGLISSIIVAKESKI